ncbi:MAG: alpha/beta hydrolase [Acidimicrobiia bacterium]|nr:alpha/beta hydrolase [Acidimicrobiia bacterium]MDH5520887.1 alpha/beta hydrolase [Acidimicrobiia bacterium]
MTVATVSHIASTDGATIAVHDFGGDGPPLLFCHATGFCGPVWKPLADSLIDRFRCHALDFRAHGSSTAPEHGHMRWSGMVDDFLAVARFLSPSEPIRAVGHSLGGGVIALAESRAPGSVHSAWTFEPILFPLPPPGEATDAPHESEMADTARRRRPQFADRAEVYERYRSRPPLDRLDDRCLRAYVDHGFRDLPDGAVELACSPEYEARTFEQHRTGADDAAAAMVVPMVVAVGGEATVPVEAAVAVTKRNPRLELRRYPDLTHFGPLEAPERVAADIARWFTSV